MRRKSARGAQFCFAFLLLAASVGGLSSSSCSRVRAPRSAADCAESLDCRRFGRCGFERSAESAPHCVVKKDEHCRRSEGCRREGKCWYEITGLTWNDVAVCTARFPGDCSNSQGCRESGNCSLRERPQHRSLYRIDRNPPDEHGELTCTGGGATNAQ